ncbi:MAG: hypothetical protein HY526_11155, partial [Betaproteobacteria bacterium]|nr:hypothetical protein [Betaproteobacteria bacterium]
MKHSIFFTLSAFVPISLSIAGVALGSQHSVHDRMMSEQAAPVKEPELKTLDDLAKEIKA